MPYSKKNLASVSATYGENENFFPSVGNICVLLRRSNSRCGIETAGKSSRPFLYPIINNSQVNRLVVCGSSNARKDTHLRPEQHRKPFLFNVQKIDAMNDNRRTAGETAMMGATYAERKEYMQKCLAESSTAILVYFDENCQIKTYGIAERGFESALLPMLEQASEKARRVAEEVML